MKRITLFAISFGVILISSVASLLQTAFASPAWPILITEIGAFEPSNLEWIEIYNSGEEPIIIEDLILFENDTNHITTAIGDNILGPAQYGLIVNKYDDFSSKYEFEGQIWDSTWSSLNQDGESLSLILNEATVETIDYPAIEEPKSLERVFNGLEYTDSWKPSLEQHSAGAVNQTELAEPIEHINSTTCDIEPETLIEEIFIEKPTLFISEISFKDSLQDWIEIYIDPKKTPVNLSDYSIRVDTSSSPLGIDEILEPTRLLIPKTLVGTTEQVILESDDEILDAICWINDSPTQSELLEIAELDIECIDSDSIEKDASIAIIDGETIILHHPTPLAPNQITNTPPNAAISIQTGLTYGDAPLSINLESNSSDPDDDNLIYLWEFGNGEESEKENPPSLTYSEPGTYEVKLTVIDTQGWSSTATMQVVVNPKEEIPALVVQPTPPETVTINEVKKYNIAISAFLPNPEGSDSGKEWIEIKNHEDNEITIHNYYLDDKDGESPPYEINNLTLAENETYKLEDEQTGITLNNTSEEVRILDQSMIPIETVAYADAQNDEIFVKTNSGEWKRESKKTETKTKMVASKTKPETQTKAQSVSINGEKNSEIRITEVFPNPKGKDENKEWIEIYNPAEETNIENWKLQVNSKEHEFKSTIISSNSYIEIPLPIPLPNTSAKIALFNFNGDLIDQTQYESAPEEKAYTKVSDTWMWLEATPGSENPMLEIIEGIISNVDEVNQKITVNGIEIFFTDQVFEEKETVKLQTLNRKGHLTLIEVLRSEKPTKEEGFPFGTVILATLLIAAIGAHPVVRKHLRKVMANA